MLPECRKKCVDSGGECVEDWHVQLSVWQLWFKKKISPGHIEPPCTYIYIHTHTHTHTHIKIPIISSWEEGCNSRFHYANGSEPDSVSIVRILIWLNALSEHLARLSAKEDCTDCINTLILCCWQDTDLGHNRCHSSDEWNVHLGAPAARTITSRGGRAK